MTYRVFQLWKNQAIAGSTALLAFCFLQPGCQTAPLEWNEVSAPAPTLRRLTQEQYRNTIVDLFGEDIAVPAQLEPDTAVSGFMEVGASVTTISSRGVEQYERAAYELAAQIMDSEELRQQWVPCTPQGSTDTACASQAIEILGLRLWRRSLEETEQQALAQLADNSAEILGDFYDGLQYAIAALLQSPNFLFRVELGETDPDHTDTLRFTNLEMASRISYFLWNSTPDEELLQAALASELTTETGLLNQIDRLLESPKAQRGVRAIFTDLYQLYRLDNLAQDPTLFTHMSAEVGPSAREETLLGIESLIFEMDEDYRKLFTSRTTHVNRTLAAIYSIPAPSKDGFAVTEIQDDTGRVGLMGQVSFLALNAHPVSTSPTLRGMFLREVLLCQNIPAPPSDVDTSIPEPSGNTVTLRDRIDEHLQNDFCASCHQLTDPIGLAYETFDALGRYRATEGGAPIDPSGELDGAEFSDATELSRLIANHERLGPCLVEHLHMYATGHELSSGEETAHDWLADEFKRGDHRILSLMREIILSPSFRQTALPAEEESE